LIRQEAFASRHQQRQLQRPDEDRPGTLTIAGANNLSGNLQVDADSLGLDVSATSTVASGLG
jgi:hypothetical protein